LILKSEGGLKRPWNILLGINIGFALLTKASAMIYFLPFWIFEVFINYRGKKKIFFRILTVLIISFIIAGPWYLLNFKELLREHNYWQHQAKMIEADPQGIIPSFFYYINAFKYTAISNNLLLFFVMGTSLFLLFYRNLRVLFSLIIWAVPAFIILLLAPNKDARFIMPILPVFAFFTIAGINVIKKKIARNIILFIVIIIGYIQFNNLSFNAFPSLIKNKTSYSNRSPVKQDWKNMEIIRFISNYSGNRHIKIGVLAECQYFNPNIFMLYACLSKLPYSIEGIGPVTPIEYIKKYDFFIIKYPDIAAYWVALHYYKFYNKLKEIGIDSFGFKKVAEFNLPDESAATLYCKEKP